MEKKPPCLDKIPAHPLGWVIVFDLDNTIVGEYYNLRKYPPRKLPLNPFAIEILRYAIAQREKEKGDVAAIFLLTNNNDTDFIDHIHLLLKGELNCQGQEIFDVIIDANHPVRELIHGGPMHGTHKKSFKDIFYGMKEIKKTSEDLLDRCIFIDDQNYHQLASELIASGRHHQFIHICPPYTTPEPLLILSAPRITTPCIFRKRNSSTAFASKPNPHLLGSATWK